MQQTSGFANCTMSFSTNTNGYGMRTRARAVSHGFEVIATESHARQYRAFYPHQRALSPFSVTLELKGYPELKMVMDWLRGYLNNFMNVFQNAISVTVPVYNFFYVGVPIGGMFDMDRTGSNVFLPTVVFETVYDPSDPRVLTSGSNSSVAKVDLGLSAGDDAGQFFYPSSPATNDPNATGQSLYDVKAYIPSAADIQEQTGTLTKPGTLTGPRVAF